MDFKKHFEAAWMNTRQFIGPVLLLTLVQVTVIALSLGILAPVTTAGYMQSLLQAQRDGRPPELRDLFSRMSLFLPLFAFFLLALLVTMIAFNILVLPGFIVAFLVIFATMYMIPLMTDKGRGIIEALKESWEMATRAPVTDQIVIALAYLILLSIGGSIPFALLIVQPFAMFLLLSVYDERLAGGAKRDRIGRNFPGTPPPPPFS